MPKDFIIKRANDVLFLRNNYRRFVLVAISLLAINIIITLVIIYNHLTAPVLQHLASTSDGEIIPIEPDN